jgi:5-methylthioadenosine/S-adenosylhomocysteine deaminase
MAKDPTQRGDRLLLKGGVVLSFDRAIGDFDRADVLIEGKKIAAIGPDIAASDATVIDASNMIVLPGFVDSHHHLYQSVLRNIQANGLLADYFRDISNGPAAVTRLFRPEDAYVGGLSGAIRSLDAGVTTVADVSQVNHSPDHTDELIRGFMESGVRIVFAYTAGVGDGLAWPQDMERLLKRHFASADQLVTPALGTTVDGAAFETARHYGLRIWTHVVGNLFRASAANLEKLGEQGKMGSDNVYIHLTNIPSSLMKRIRDTGGAASFAVPIEMTMQHGTPPLQQALDHGIRPSLSSDVETSMSADMFTIMRSCFTLQRMLVNERALAGEQDLPALLTARDVLELATIQGARDCGLDAKTGSLTPGKEADIVLLRHDTPNAMPLNNACGAIVTGMDTSNVDTVLVAGRILKRDGKLVATDVAHLRKIATASRDHLVGQMGWPRSVVDEGLPGR